MKKTRKQLDPQLRHDPTFLHRVEQILEKEINTIHTWDEIPENEPIQTDAEQENLAQETTQNYSQNKARSRTKNISPKKSLLKELEALLPQLDEEGLAFLLEQGRIHLYNMKVDELNALSQGIDQQGSRKTRNKAADQVPGTRAPSFQIKAGSGGGSYHVAYNGNWKLFSDVEMLKMVQIAHGEGTKEERARRLFRWLRTERSDVLQDIPLQGSQNLLFLEFLSLLQKTFKIRTDKS